MKASNNIKVFLRDERGFSTTGMVIALLITLSLVLSSAQVYQINSASATIQNVADAATLAAENEVAEFYIIARVCDAVILSLSLTGVAAIGIGVVALCVPALTPLSEKLIKTGSDILKARNNFAEKAARGLNALQEALPFMSAANAESVIMANSGGSMDANYLGIAVLLPFKGEEITVGTFGAADDLIKGVEEHKDTVEEAAQAAEEAACEVKRLKEQAFLYDCGNNPGYCMYERADQLASLAEYENPLYHSVDAWSFSVALKRAQAYYAQRFDTEVPTDLSVEGLADSQLRKRFYAFASQELAQGYVIEEGQEGFQAYFPLLPKNSTEMRATSLYTQVVYPITRDNSGTSRMHAWNACPEVTSDILMGMGSLAQLEEGDFSTCPQCKFSVSSFGKIAAASSSIESGFEYHYRIVAELAVAYEKAQEAYTPHATRVKELTGDLLDLAKEACLQAASYRLDVSPPGRIGAVSLVVNRQEVSASQNFFSTFVSTETTLGTQAALSASTLVGDSSEEGATVISSLLDGIVQTPENPGLTMGDEALDLWSFLLATYTKGQKALKDGIEHVLDGIPLASESGLGSWAADVLSDLIETLGFEPVDLRSLKPVLLNSVHVLAADDSSFSKALLDIKQSYLVTSGEQADSFLGAVVSQLEYYALESVEEFDDEIVIASIELIEGAGPTIPLTIALPPAVKVVAKGFIHDAAEFLRGLDPSLTGVRRWE